MHNLTSAQFLCKKELKSNARINEKTIREHTSYVKEKARNVALQMEHNAPRGPNKKPAGT